MIDCHWAAENGVWTTVERLSEGSFGMDSCWTMIQQSRKEAAGGSLRLISGWIAANLQGMGGNQQFKCGETLGNAEEQNTTHLRRDIDSSLIIERQNHNPKGKPAALFEI